MSSSSQDQPAIAYFAPELIDNILGHLVALSAPRPQRVRVGEKPDQKFLQYRALEALSLTSRIWREQAQRRMMRELVVKSGTQAERLIDGFASTGLQFYVQDLRIGRFEFGKVPTPREILAADAVSREQFVGLFPLFPHARHLQIVDPTFIHFSPSDFSIL